MSTRHTIDAHPLNQQETVIETAEDVLDKLTSARWKLVTEAERPFRRLWLAGETGEFASLLADVMEIINGTLEGKRRIIAVQRIHRLVRNVCGESADVFTDELGGVYRPTDEEIRAACLDIQKGWSRQERSSRMMHDLAEPYTIPQCRLRRRKGGRR